MITAGKSDVFEAVIQILVLKILHEHGTANGPRIVKELLRKTDGLMVIEEASGYIALAKLASSGWIRSEECATSSRSGKYVLSSSASRCLTREMETWQGFVDQWPQIRRILNDVVRM
jgi:DNA-binding PadR family transcriptional regulator